jgi:hypothetical protein
MIIKNKPAFRIEKGLLDLQPIKDFSESHPSIEVDGLVLISNDTARIFYRIDVENDKSLTSEMIKL